MAQDYSEYLAIHVLNEQQYVSYRSLSRALKVHSNLAKQMLYEFHRKQNAKKPGTVHATYLISGTKPTEATAQTNGIHSQDGEDTVMQSSPFPASSSAPQPDDGQRETIDMRWIMLAKEEHLEQAKNSFETISSIHIYSLEANGLSDIHVLTECNRKVASSYASEDPLEVWKQYGTIQNPNVKRRTRRTAPPPPAPVSTDAAAKAKQAAPAATKPAVIEKTSKEAASAKPTPEPEKKGGAKPAPPKRESSNIFKSFATSKTKQESQSSAEASPAPAQDDEPMTGFSDDDMDDEEANEPEAEAKAPTGKSKKEREAELHAMMDQDDSPMEDAPTPTDDPGEPEEAIDTHVPVVEEEPKETVVVENGRRRGRRRIMKKKTAKDAEGYLVTKEEAAWESFSEDEPAPKKIKVPPTSSMIVGSKPGAKKIGKPGQGNIMSFFGKK